MQTKILCSIKDKKANFIDPFVEPNELVAIRNFSYSCKDEKTNLFVYPEDYALYQIGMVDVETGIVTPVEPKILAEAVTYAKAE